MLVFLEKELQKAIENWDFEKATELRDRIALLSKKD
jgi:protein-arginine kinase activator protein McsA